jgi:hypothetical protein
MVGVVVVNLSTAVKYIKKDIVWEHAGCSAVAHLV